MMKDLLLFARPPKPKRVADRRRASWSTTTAGLLSQDPALRDVDVEVEGVAPPVPADPEMLRIVFQNLLINGAHAMQGKGTIRVAVDELSIRRARSPSSTPAPAFPPTSARRSSRRSSPPSRAAPAWACRRRSGSSRPTTARSPSTARRPAAPRSLSDFR